MKWPRGKYNNQRIVGIRIVLHVNLRWWNLKIYWSKFNSYSVHIGPLHIWFYAEYNNDAHKE